MVPSTLVVAHLSPAFDPGVMVPEAKTIPAHNTIKLIDFVIILSSHTL
jgi:hypothetical protein